MSSRYRTLSRAELATLLPELLLIGHLVDRAGMPWCTMTFSKEAMTRIAIEEWAGASPIYTKRMQRALKFEGDDVVTIFKGMQLEIGAPPQFMDFRYRVEDSHHGGFHLDHCGALLDVEPVGEGFVRAMCHEIEDPTFDATAVATNPKARMRPIHRPPRTPSDRHPHCDWTVVIDEDADPVEPIPALAVIQRTHVANLALDEIDATDDGASDYSGDLVSDIDFGAFSHSALVRLADEVCIQMHLLNLSFVEAVKAEAAKHGATEHGAAEHKDPTTAVRTITTNQLVGHAGVAAERLHRALLSSGRTPEDAARLLELHPMMNPSAYVDLTREGATLRVRHSAAHQDGSWVSLCGPHEVRPLQAAVRAVDPSFDVEVSGTADDWTATVVATDTVHQEFDEVALTKISGGANFQFAPRNSLPLFVV